MFRPFNFLLLLIAIYLTIPTLGFSLFPEYFDFSAVAQNFAVLGLYITVLLVSAWLGTTLESRMSAAKRAAAATVSKPTMQAEPEVVLTGPAFRFLTLAGIMLATVCGVTAAAVGAISGEGFSPSIYRLSIASSENLPLIIVYNLFALLTFTATVLTIYTLRHIARKRAFYGLLLVFLVLIYATGQRSLVILVLLSYLLLNVRKTSFASALKTASALLAGLLVILLLGVARQGDDLSVAALIWQLSVRFDLFYPQFFNFLDQYRTLPDIGYGFYHFTYPLQVVPSIFWPGKPLTFLHFVNRDLMGIAEGTGNDFSAFAEFVYDYGVALGAVVYGLFSFVAAILIQKIYLRARSSPVFYSIYFPCLLVYISLVLLTGVSNQAHMFAAIGIAISIWFSKHFVGIALRGNKYEQSPSTSGSPSS